MAEFLLPFQRTALEPKIPPFNEYEPKYVHSKDHLVSRIQNIPIDDEITHIKVLKSEYPEVEKETIFQQIDFNTPKISRQEEMEKCMSQAKHDADYIIYLKRMKSQLHSNFQEYVRERLKIERESARKLKNPSKAFIKTITDVETRLCYIEQFIDVINQNEAFQFEEAEEKYYKLMMYNEFIKEMTNIKKFRGILKKAERDVIEEENQIKSRINSNNQKAMIDEGRKLLEEQLAALNNI